MNAENQLKISIGIPAYNEEANIQKLLEALRAQKLRRVQISEIIVIASGCTDRTVQIVEQMQKEFVPPRHPLLNKILHPARTLQPRDRYHLKDAPHLKDTTYLRDNPYLSAQTVTPALRLIIQKERAGKSSAVNLFIKEAKEDLLVLESADTIPAPETIENLCAPFKDEQIGLAGAHPIPTNNPNTFIGFCVQTMWDMHHQIAQQTPKCGELIAFRKPIITGIPAQSPVDEASIEAAVKEHNLKITYVPTAIVYNKGPETIREFIAQRRRISAGHFWLRKNFAHKPSTAGKRTALWLTLKRLSWNPKRNLWLIGMILLETWSKLLGRYDYYIKKRDHMVWDRIGTSKNPNLQ